MPKYSQKKEAQRNDPSKAKTPEEIMKWEIAKELDFDELVEYLPTNKAEYVNFILYGK